MKRIFGLAIALGTAASLSACTYEAQRDILTGGIAGGTVGRAHSAIRGDDKYGENLWIGAAIGAGTAAVRHGVESVLDGGSSGTYQTGQGYDEPYYDQGPVYGQPGYGQPVGGYLARSSGLLIPSSPRETLFWTRGPRQH